MAKYKGTAGADRIIGTSLIDEITGGAGNDYLDGMEGNDFVDGNSGDDTIYGGTDNDYLLGNSGNDWISDGSGDDYVSTGSSNDYVLAGDGNDTFIGGLDFDTIDFSSSSGAVRVDLSKGTATGQGTDTVQGFESVIGSNFSDNLRGGAANEVIIGGGGSDKIRGAAGNDTLTGGAGNDTFQFKTQDVVGASGADHFVDTITDFSTSDRIDLREIMASLTYDTVDQVLRIEADGAGNSTLEVNRGSGFEAVAVLQNFTLATDVPVSALTADGIILV